jgi:hypothetical protein
MKLPMHSCEMALHFLAKALMKVISRLFSSHAIQIRNGAARCIKGKILSSVIYDITSLAEDYNLKEGEIWINQINKVSFSIDIPQMLHQRIRNVISS